MRFALEIRLGNEAMRTAEDVADALVKAGERMKNMGKMRNGYNGLLRDLNGNVVGEWEVTE